MKPCINEETIHVIAEKLNAVINVPLINEATEYVILVWILRQLCSISDKILDDFSKPQTPTS